MTYNLLVRLIESISASEEEGAAGDVSGMETEDNAFDAFAVPEPIDDFGEGMVDMDTGGDDMDRTEWSERATGHAAQGGNFYEVTYLEIISDITTRSQARVHSLPPHDHRGHALRPDHRPPGVQLL